MSRKKTDEYLLDIINRGNRLKCGFIEDEIYDLDLREQIDNIIRSFGGKI